MRIVKVSASKDKIVSNEKLTSAIMNKLVLVCKEEESSPLKSKKFQKLLLFKKSLTEKDKELTELLKKSSSMYKNIQEELTSLEGKNLRLRSSLLELLGSES